MKQTLTARPIKAHQLGIDHLARIQCALAFNLTFEEVEAMPVEHITMTELPHNFHEGDEQ